MDASMSDDGEVLFVDFRTAPKAIIDALRALGVTYERWEGQPMADQAKLSGCRGAPADLPPWLRR